MYVSFNDGDDWQPLHAEPAATSIRDLIVHGDDLVVATHGRGFWILDDITPLRELASSVASSSVVSGSSRTSLVRRRPDSTFTDPRSAIACAGTRTPTRRSRRKHPAAPNPPDGAMIDYVLAANARGPVTLEITTAAGKLVRRYSSADPPEQPDEKDFNVPIQWARLPRALPATKGMHRFVWDLRYPRPDAVQRDLPISAIYHDTPVEPLGVFAMPGVYTVKLTVDGDTFTRPLTVKMDPRAAITAIGLTRQFALATRIAAMMNRSYAALNASRDPLDAKRRADLTTLNGDLATAYEVVEGADRAPTAQAFTTVADLERRLAALLK